jgi:hypothetical protein
MPERVRRRKDLGENKLTAFDPGCRPSGPDRPSGLSGGADRPSGLSGAARVLRDRKGPSDAVDAATIAHQRVPIVAASTGDILS